MNKYLRYLAVITLALLSITLTEGCKKDEKDPYANVKGTYFSIRQYGIDSWNTHSGEPFLIMKTVRVNNNLVDSSYTTSDTLNWGRIFKIFFETDISDRKFLGHYKYNQFDDDADNTRNFFYEANPDDEDLYTKKLLITINPFNSLVKGIYIEASKKDMWGETTYKLYYKPMARIQIQTIEKPVFGDNKHTVTDYEFVR